MEKLEKFRLLGLSESTLDALRKKGFEEPTPIQQKTIPVLLKGEVDIIGQAQTGTGKTAAFGLPILEGIKERAKAIQSLILVPTRELAIQVSEELNSYKGEKLLQIAPIYGGQSIEEQFRRLKKGIDVVVGTPGRILDHIKRKSLMLKNISYLVLDEADEMLNMGFIDDVEEIIKNTGSMKRMLLFSATMPEKIVSIAEKYMKEYEMIGVKKEQLTTNLTDQIYFEVAPSDKFDALCRIVDFEHEFYGLVFCRTKVDVDTVANKLIERGYDAEALHGDISQNQREIILQKFRKQRINILVATDVAARGIDIHNLTHVINYSLPQDPESYVHRIGRTGRAGKEGTAITFVTPDEYRRLIFIKKIAKTDIRKEKLPKIADVINQKKSRIKMQLANIIKSEDMNGYLELAQEMLKENEAGKVLAALLKHSFQDELDESNYNEIRDVSIDRKGTSRLFVGLGKIDGMTPKKLADFIKQQAKVYREKIKDIQIFDKFSFITVPFEEAEIILNIFKKKKGGKRPIIERAKR
ncbi:MAG: DEAD/DEAH box helicase [Candidatus Brocadia sinica]|nr:DEAD/DEAH box helicase [Candidatus Brocadia sinica]NUO04244.1 DEAD/DEAH box helicase [Candidatus Brocadia sinica]